MMPYVRAQAAPNWKCPVALIERLLLLAMVLIAGYVRAAESTHRPRISWSSWQTILGTRTWAVTAARSRLHISMRWLRVG